MDSATKEDLLARFRAYLDQADETPPLTETGNVGGEYPSAAPNASVPDVSVWDGSRQDTGTRDERARNDSPLNAQAPDADAPDLFSLLSELAALKNEVKLESRQVKTALGEFRGVFEALELANNRAEQEQQRRREQARAAQARERKDLLLELLDLRDRLQAGQGAAAGYRPSGLFGRKQVRVFAASMAEGLAMNLRRLDETLARRGVQPLPAVGRPFDPHRMHAAELVSDPQRAAGEVIAERRSGFLLDGELLRSAEVVVNRPDLADTGSSSSTKDLS